MMEYREINLKNDLGDNCFLALEGSILDIKISSIILFSPFKRMRTNIIWTFHYVIRRLYLQSDADFKILQ